MAMALAIGGVAWPERNARAASAHAPASVSVRLTSACLNTAGVQNGVMVLTLACNGNPPLAFTSPLPSALPAADTLAGIDRRFGDSTRAQAGLFVTGDAQLPLGAAFGGMVSSLRVIRLDDQSSYFEFLVGW